MISAQEAKDISNKNNYKIIDRKVKMICEKHEEYSRLSEILRRIANETIREMAVRGERNCRFSLETREYGIEVLDAIVNIDIDDKIRWLRDNEVPYFKELGYQITFRNNILFGGRELNVNISWR